MQAIGQAYGLVWTPEGSTLVQMKAKIRKGSGKIYVDGDVDHAFLASMETAFNLFQVATQFDLEKHNLTFDVPGHVDGISAALPMFIALNSAFTKQPVNQNVAFTGALSEEGAVLPVPGIIAKIAACRRANLDTIIFPMENLPELPEFSGVAPWGNLAICPIVRAIEGLIMALPVPMTKATLKK